MQFNVMTPFLTDGVGGGHSQRILSSIDRVVIMVVVNCNRAESIKIERKEFKKLKMI